jgi:hypothetical protein
VREGEVGKMAYKEQFLVRVTLTPGGGYEDCLPPSKANMKGAIRDAIRNGLSPSGYIEGTATVSKRITTKRLKR